MAFGIDDALTAAAAGISLTDTCVQVVTAYRKKGVPLDIERLIEEVRVTALQRIDDADLALAQLERALVDNGVKLGQTLQEVIAATTSWQSFEAHRLKRIRRSFNVLADATYGATDDIPSLVRCHGHTAEMGAAVVESARAQHELHSRLLAATSVKESIDLLRAELTRHKNALMQKGNV